jgi:hypothetical protein
VAGMKKKTFKKNGNSLTGAGVDLRPVGDCGLTPVPVGLFQFFKILVYFLKKNFWKFGKWTRAFERMGVQHPHYLKLAPTLGSANSSKIHGEWRFHFFSIFFSS